MMRDTNWDWLRDVKRRLYLAAPRGTSKRPVITSVQLVDLGVELMEESDLSGTPIRMADAIRFRDGLMIATLGYVPLRHKNFAAIEIGSSLLKDAESWSIVIPPEDTKTGTDIEFQVPELLRPYLLTYLARVRPRLLRGSECKVLWVSYKGGPLSYSAVGPVLTRNTIACLGIRIAPHDARDAAATTWAIAAPEQIGVARDLLAHSDLRTTTKHYNRAKGIEASRAYERLIAQRRKKGSYAAE